MAKKKQYSKAKIVIWRFGRIFLLGALVSLSANIQSLNSTTDIKNALIIPAITAGGAALTKALRLYLGGEDYSSPIHKSPI